MTPAANFKTRASLALGLNCMAAVALLALSAAASAADNYPNRPIKLVVPYPPGGGADTLARLLGRHLSERLGQPVIVDNKVGAGTTIGVNAVARSTPDGYTLLMASTTFTANPALQADLPFDAAKDFRPVSVFANSPFLLVTHPKLPARSLSELVQYAKRRPGQLNYASYGVATSPHMVAELFQMETGTRFLHVPYKGGSPAVLATVSGETQLVFSSVLPVLPHLKTGALNALAVASAKRFPLLPDVPTFAEAGLPFESGVWFGVVAPARTPSPIVSRLSQAIISISKLPEVKDQLLSQGAEPVGNTPEQFAEFIKMETSRWADIVKKANIQPER